MIETVSIIGLGALGVMYGSFFAKTLGREHVRIVVNKERKERYETEGIFLNGQRCDFYYVCEDEDVTPADLVIFAVKFHGLPSAIESARKQIGEKTIIMSVMNGIVSEDIIGETYGAEKMVYTTVQGMDAMKVGNQAKFANVGIVTFGERDDSRTWKIEALEEFFERVGIRYEVPENMLSRLWAKLMLNDGVNQSAAVFETGYGGLQAEGKPRETMKAAMRETMTIAAAEGVYIEPEMLDRYVALIDGLKPENEPSLRQDTRAHRKTEVELFAGTICALGKKHQIPTPINDFLYEGIKKIEASYFTAEK